MNVRFEWAMQWSLLSDKSPGLSLIVLSKNTWAEYRLYLFCFVPRIDSRLDANFLKKNVLSDEIKIFLFTHAKKIMISLYNIEHSILYLHNIILNLKSLLHEKLSSFPWGWVPFVYKFPLGYSQGRISFLHMTALVKGLYFQIEEVSIQRRVQKFLTT